MFEDDIYEPAEKSTLIALNPELLVYSQQVVGLHIAFTNLRVSLYVVSTKTNIPLICIFI